MQKQITRRKAKWIKKNGEVPLLGAKFIESQIDTEHILLGLIQKGTGEFLQELGVNLEKLEMEMKRNVGQSQFDFDLNRLMVKTDDYSNQVRQYAMEEAQKVEFLTKR